MSDHDYRLLHALFLSSLNEKLNKELSCLVLTDTVYGKERKIGSKDMRVKCLTCSMGSTSRLTRTNTSSMRFGSPVTAFSSGPKML